MAFAVTPSPKPGLVVAMLALLTACTPVPRSYSIPAQHKPPADSGAGLAAPERGEYFVANAPDAAEYIVKDINAPEGADWRWTLAEPELRFLIRKPGARRLHMEFVVHERTFADTGPLKIVLFLNGRELDRITYPAFGDKVYEKSIAEKWLRPGAANVLRMQILNPWHAPDPGVKLGILLKSVGFIPQ